LLVDTISVVCSTDDIFSPCPILEEDSRWKMGDIQRALNGRHLLD
jgi:hypothetical protein